MAGDIDHVGGGGEDVRRRMQEVSTQPSETQALDGEFEPETPLQAAIHADTRQASPNQALHSVGVQGKADAKSPLRAPSGSAMRPTNLGRAGRTPDAVQLAEAVVAAAREGPDAVLAVAAKRLDVSDGAKLQWRALIRSIHPDFNQDLSPAAIGKLTLATWVVQRAHGAVASGEAFDDVQQDLKSHAPDATAARSSGPPRPAQARDTARRSDGANQTRASGQSPGAQGPRMNSMSEEARAWYYGTDGVEGRNDSRAWYEGVGRFAKAARRARRAYDADTTK